jgi:hypothetical protein
MNGRAVGWIGNGYVEVKGRPAVELPWFVARSGGAMSRPEESHGAVCPVHFVETSVTGLCELCE